MRFNTGYNTGFSARKVAIIIATIVFLWFFSGIIISGEEGSSAKQDSVVDVAPSVEVMRSSAVDTFETVDLRGVAQAQRKVVIKPKISGQVLDIIVQKGNFVREDEVIVTLDIEDRKALYQRAQALVAQRKLEYEAAKALSKKGLQSQTRKAESFALLKQAEAEMATAGLAVEDSSIKAPFAGIINKVYVEKGDVVSALQSDIAVIMSNDEFLVSVHVPEWVVNQLSIGQEVAVTVLDKITKSGVINYISRIADEATRTFAVEILIDNDDGNVKHGMSARVAITVGKVKAHFIPSSILSLSSSGEIGVKVVDENGEVGLYPIEIIDQKPDGVFVSGLPETVTFITTGQGFVNEGDIVRVVD